MTDTTDLITFGVLIGICVLALKTGLGCGFANLKRREILFIASIYFVVSIIMGYLIGIIPVDLTQNILAAGVTMHLIIAVGLIYFGVRTKKEWLSDRCDLSRKSFLWLSLPCPVCLTSLFLACTVLADAIDLSNIIIGAMIGMIFFTGVCLSSFSIAFTAKRFNYRNPSALGTVMILFGLFYLLSPLIIPAYMQGQTVQTSCIRMDYSEIIISISLMAVLAIIGFTKDKYRRSKDQRG